MATNFARLLSTPTKARKTPTVEEMICDDPEAFEAEQEAVADVKKILKELREELEKLAPKDA